MPATLQVESVGDVIRGTLRELGEDHMTDLTTDLQEHPAAQELVNDNKMKVDGGTSIQFNVMIGHNDAAEFVGLGNVDNVNEVDVTAQGNVPWRHMETKMAIEERLVTMNAYNPRRVFDMVKTQKNASFVAWVEKFERAFWSKPATSADVKTMWGLQMYVTMVGATSSFGFNGTVPAGFTSVAELDSTAIPRWRNGNFTYVTVNKADLVAKLREAATKCHFTPPTDIPTYERGKGRAYYSNYALIAALETLAENQNDKLGNDVASMDGKVLFRRLPVKWVPVLDEDTTNPFYGIDWNTISVKYLGGEWMKQRGPFQAPLQHATQWTFWDTSLNLYCDNRRHNFVCSL